MIINYKQFDDHTYFIMSGQCNIYVVPPAEGTKELFQVLKEGSCFNFVNSVMGHYSLFQVEAVYCDDLIVANGILTPRTTSNKSTCVLLKLHKDDIYNAFKKADYTSKLIWSKPSH